MSGSGGGSSRVLVGVSSGGTPCTNECSSVDVETILNSPVASVVRGLKKNDELQVDMLKTPTGIATLVAKDSAGNVAGSLTPPSLVVIINCIEAGYDYVAILLDDVTGGVIRVRIRRKR